MAHDVSIGGRDYRVRAPLGVFALGAATLGTYWLYWYYLANDDVRMYLRNYSIRPLISTLAIVGLFLALPLVVIAVLTDVWWLIAVASLLIVMAMVGILHTARRVITAQQRAGVEPSSAGIALMLFLGGFLGTAYLQAGLNRTWVRAAGEERERLAASSAASVEREPVQAFPRPAPKTGTNLVAPGDVGSRVTFQFELPNGYTTEAVGVFERWDSEAETYFVRKKDGTEVRVPARGVRFGKVIPARPAAPTAR
jgi:hypothetical protein